MDTITVSNSPQLSVVSAAADSSTRLLLAVTARLALTHSVVVMDGGNRFNAYAVARQIRQHQVDVTGPLRRIQVARAFTCQQLFAIMEATPCDQRPKIVLDLLGTFHPDELSVVERMQLFTRCLKHLYRMSRTAHTLVGVRLPAADDTEAKDRWTAIREIADQVFIAAPQPAFVPARLF